MDQHTQAQLLKVLNAYPDVHFAMVFGSVAAGSAHANSDLDLAVMASQALSAHQKMSLIEALALAVGRPVDLIDLRVIGEPLLGEVLKGQRLLGNSTLHGQLLSRHLKDAADFIPLQRRIQHAQRQAWINQSNPDHPKT